ncbi:MAG: alcohol dehydrogenase catalytic domain-containing protein, partial [Actinomycetota bacterium]
MTETMKAFVLRNFDEEPVVSDVPAPPFGSSNLIVRVHAASINGWDSAVAAGYLREMMPYEFPVTLGKDFAGVVQSVGEAVTGFSMGDEVFGFLTTGASLHEGSIAELIAVPENGFVALKPANLDSEEAAALAFAGSAALVAVDAIHPSERDTILINGATGGVGSVAVQLASKRGAKVFATALPGDEEYLRDLGASET